MADMWILAAVGSAFFAGITAILAKIGTIHTDSDIATAMRTIIVTIFAWLMVFLVGSASTITDIRPTSLLFLVLSGAATGASWICYFAALSIGRVNTVVPIDKSSTVLTVLLAIVCFGETGNLAIKLVGTAMLGIGILLMVERADEKNQRHRGTRRNVGASVDATSAGNAPSTDDAPHACSASDIATPADAGTNRASILYAIASAVFAALTAILAKMGITDVESNLGTAIRTLVVLALSWSIVVARGKHTRLRAVDRRELGFICLSGVATGASWLCYYQAIQHGIVSVVVPIDKLSILVSVAFSVLILHERLSRRSTIGLALMTLGTLTMAILT